MQRLYSTFPNSWPGAGLFLLRIALGLAQLSLLFFDGFPVETQLTRAAIALSLVMLGPGAWSIDRRLFGRKRIDLPAKQPSSP
jgi:uncharacterized membrane protein YphA (DoxX/SURF4 family)